MDNPIEALCMLGNEAIECGFEFWRILETRL